MVSQFGSFDVGIMKRLYRCLHISSCDINRCHHSNTLRINRCHDTSATLFALTQGAANARKIEMKCVHKNICPNAYYLLNTTAFFESLEGKKYYQAFLSNTLLTSRECGFSNCKLYYLQAHPAREHSGYIYVSAEWQILNGRSRTFLYTQHCLDG